MVYRCSVCGYVYEEEKEGRPFSELKECPLCKQPPEKFEAVKALGQEAARPESETLDLSYPQETRKTDSGYRYMQQIQAMAISGQSAIEAMGTQMKMPDWDDVLVLGAQLNPMPLEEHAEVSLKTVIVKHWRAFEGDETSAGERERGGRHGNVQRRGRHPAGGKRGGI